MAGTRLLLTTLCLLATLPTSVQGVRCPKPKRHGRPPSPACVLPSDPNKKNRTPLQKWFGRSEFEDLFPKANHGWGPSKCSPYSYDAFIIASRYFPEFGTASRASGKNSYTKEQLQRRDVAAFFAHIVQETGETDYSLFNSSLTTEQAKECFYRGGLYHYFEGGPRSPFFPSVNRSRTLKPEDGKICMPEGRYCKDTPELNFWYPCDVRNVTSDPDGKEDAAGDNEFKSCYFGRGPFQLSWNYNYGQFQHFLAVHGIKVDLLTEPHLLLEKMDPPLAMLSALWFYMTPQPPKPAMHDIIMGNWRPSLKNSRAGYEGSVFGPTSLVINNECHGESAEEPGPPGENRRIKAFKFFAKKLDAPLENSRLMSCKGMLDNFDASPHKYSWQPDWANMWRSEPCDCAPAPYPGALPYYDPKVYPERLVRDNDRNRLRCVYAMYANQELYQITPENSPCIKYKVRIRLSKDGV